MIVEDLLDSLENDAPIRSVLVGAHWTVVCSLHCGMAAALRGEEAHGHSRIRDVGRLHQKSARHLAEYALSQNQLEASIGVAAINSLLGVDERQIVEVNALDVLADQGRGRNIALVGHFPFIPRLKERLYHAEPLGNLWVLELNPVEGEYPAQAAPDLIPQADMVAMTASTLINHTMDGLLGLCRPDATVMILGPSTPLSPRLFSYGVNILAGTRVVDEAAVLRTVGQGASFQQVEGVRLVAIQAP